MNSVFNTTCIHLEKKGKFKLTTVLKFKISLSLLNLCQIIYDNCSCLISQHYYNYENEHDIDGK